MSERRQGEDGAATVLVVAMAGVLVFVMVGLGAAGGLLTAQRRAQTAADLAALAGAALSGDALAGAALAGDACAESARVAAANGATLDACRVDGRDVRLVAAVPLTIGSSAMPWTQVTVTAEARAGPG